MCNDCSLVNKFMLLITVRVCASSSRDLLCSRQGCSHVPQVSNALRAAYHEGKTHFAHKSHTFSAWHAILCSSCASMTREGSPNRFSCSHTAVMMMVVSVMKPEYGRDLEQSTGLHNVLLPGAYSCEGIIPLTSLCFRLRWGCSHPQQLASALSSAAHLLASSKFSTRSGTSAHHPQKSQEGGCAR